MVKKKFLLYQKLIHLRKNKEEALEEKEMFWQFVRKTVKVFQQRLPL